MLLEEALKKFCPIIKELCVGDQCIAWKVVKLSEVNTGVNDDLIDRITTLIYDNLKIEAIKELRSAIGLGLAESKNHIENHAYGDVIRNDWRYNKYSNRNSPRGFCHVYQNTLEQNETSYNSF